ncbi:RHS repeat-associated protein [Streptomyces sp. TLI_235]|nr:RHS repeat-associated protein [Streptomyces sp. TLI_235]
MALLRGVGAVRHARARALRRLATITAAAVLGSLIAPVSVAVAASPDFSRKWEPPNTSLPKTASVEGHAVPNSAVTKPAHPVPPVWAPAKLVNMPPRGHASVKLAASPKPQAKAQHDSAAAVGPQTPADGLPVALAPLAATAAGEQTVDVDVPDAKTAQAAGISGLAMALSRPDKADARPVRIFVDSTRVDTAFGADWIARSHLVALPACSLTSPQVKGCLEQTPVPSHYDAATKKLIADITLPASSGSTGTHIQALTATATSGNGSVVLAAVSGSSSGAGSYTATPLNPSQAWTSGGSSGGFAYSYPIQSPATLGGAVPGVTLGYDSTSVDGKTSATNSQASWIGDGWDYSAGFVERFYKPCSKAGIAGSGDQCWAGANLTLSLAGHSGELVPDDASCQSDAPATTEQSNCTWRIKGDDGTKVEFLTGATNGTWNGSFIKVTDTGGTVYYFGLNHLPSATGNPTGTGPASGAAWTVPVYSPNRGDPCHDSAKGNDSWCQTAWRWNLDYVVDTHGNLTTYTYTPESNSYARGGGQNNGTGTNTSYTRSGVLAAIGYGQLLSDQLNAAGGYKPAAQIVFTPAERCVTSTTACDPSQRTTANATNWPDVPLDEQCGATGTCTNYGPTFWTTKWLSAITTQVRVNGAYQDVDSYALKHVFINVQNTTESTQVPWLASVQHTGKDIQASSTQVVLPAVSFTAMLLPNRVDGSNLVPSPPAYNRPRIQLITTETGGTIGVDYKPAGCSRVNHVMPASADSDTRSCYNVKWSPPGSIAGSDPIDDWFLRYPVNTVTVNANTPGAVPMATAYTYGNAAWHRNDSPLTDDKNRTWDVFRGYASVTTVRGSGNDGPKAQSSTTYYQGMDGDKTAIGTRSATVAGPNSGPVTDADWLSGQTLESDTYTQADGSITAYTVNTSSGPATTATHSRGTLPALIARYSSTTVTSVSKARKADGTWGTTTKTTTTDAAHNNRQLTALDAADGLPDVCTRYAYATGPDPQRSSLSAQSVVVSGANACSATASATNTVSGARTLYDSLDYGKAGAVGDVTASQVLDSWDSGGNPVYTTTATSTYDDYGRGLTATDPNATDKAHTNGATTTTSYGAANAGELPNSLTLTSPAPAGAVDVDTGRTATTTLDTARSLPLTVADTNGRVTTQKYDALGRLTAVWLPGRATTASASKAFAYSVPGIVNNAAVPPTIITTTLAGTTAQADNHTLSIQIMDGLGRTIQTQSSPAASAYTGRMINDAAYDSQGRILRTNAAWYNNDTAPVTALYQTTTGEVPAQTYTVYDGLGRPVTSQFLAHGTVQTTTTTGYPGVDRVDVSPPSGATPTSTVRDARGRTAQLWQYKTPTATGNSADADITTYTYTPAGQAATRTDAAGNTWTYGYDQRGRQNTATDPDTGTSTSTYDADGRLATTTDARGQSLTRTYDLLGRPTATYTGTAVDTAKQLTALTYDTVVKGQPASSTRYVGGASGSAYTTAVLAYNTAYQPTKTTTTIPGSEIGSATPFTYTYQAVYDPGTGLLTKDSRSAVGDIAAELVNYGYDTNGTLQSYGSPTFTYDLSNDYDAHGRPIRATLNPWGTQIVVTNTFDEPTGRQLTQFVDKQTAGTGAVQQTTYTYDPAGRITAIRGIADNTPSATDLQCFTYDYLGRLTTAWSDTGALTQSVQPTVGGRGSCANTSPTSGAQAPLKTTVGGPAAYWQSYTYDLTGNRKQLVQHNPAGDTTKDTTLTQDFPAPGTVNTKTTAPGTGGGTGGPHTLLGTTATGITGPTGSTLQYDAAGNTTAVTDTSGTTSLTWDVEEKLVSTTKTGGAGSTTYLYDATGNQLIRRDPGKTTINLGGGDELVYNTTAKTTTGVRYYQIPAGVTLVRQGGTSTYQISDHHGTGSLALDATTLAESRRPSDPFGNPRGTQPTTWAGDHGFVGGTKDDATGLTNLGAREYQPTTGRFLNPDPILAPDNPQQWNGYAYSNNDPVNLSDPSGLFCDGCTTNNPGSAWNDGHPGCAATTCYNSDGSTTNVENTVHVHNTPPHHKSGDDGKDHYVAGIRILTAKELAARGWSGTYEEQVALWTRNVCLGVHTPNYDAMCSLAGRAGMLDATSPGQKVVAAAFTALAFCVLAPEVCVSAAFAAAQGEVDVASGGSLAVGGSSLYLVERAAEAFFGKMAAREVDDLAAGCFGRNSFTADTHVLMADGSTKPISDIKVGDEVSATNPVTGATKPEKVVATITTPDDQDFTDLTTTKTQTAATEKSQPQTSLTTTWHHPFWDATTQRWTDVSQLQVGHTLRQPDGETVLVTAVRNYHQHALTFNLTIADLHTYYVLSGNTPVLVHNDGGSDLVTVGRWMSTEEYQKMLDTGMVQAGAGDRTFVVYPASPDAYISARPGSVYVEFDVPHSLLSPGGRPGDYKLSGPASLDARLAARKGLPAPQMPAAENIRLGGGSGCP